MARRNLPSEASMLLPTVRALLRLGWAKQMTPAATELKWHQKRLDLAISAAPGTVLAVELKVSKWRSAIDQAYVNRWAVDSSWVGIWHECITAETHTWARDHGVGILAVTGETAYPLLQPGPPVHDGIGERLSASIRADGSRVRDLLSAEKRSRLALA